MLVLPIVARELLIQARRKSTYWIRAVASAVAGFLMLWLLVVGAGPVPSMSQGKTLFEILSALAFVYCLLIGALVTADCLSAEKRDGTLGLIFLTDLKGYDVVLGKLASSSLHAVYGLIAVVPMLSLALLFGGVTRGEIVRMVLLLGNTLFFSLAMGMFVSTLSKHDRKALFATVVLILVVSGGPYELVYLLETYTNGIASGWREVIEAASPAFAYYLAQTWLFGKPNVPAFYGSLALTHLLAWMLLGLASGIVPHVWKDRPQGPRRQRWSEWWRRRSHGNAEQRARFRGRLLERNPCLWLSCRERYKALLVWLLIIPLAAIGFWIRLRYHDVFYGGAIFLLFVLHLLLKGWFAGEICNRWIEDRRSGALELLVCAPLQAREFVQGQTMALWRQFGWPIVVTQGLTVFAWVGLIRKDGVDPNSDPVSVWLLVTMSVLMADLAALRWVGGWLGLTARGLNRAVAGTLGRVLGLRSVIYLLFMGGVAAWSWIGSGQSPRIFGARFWLIPALTLDLFFAWSARRRFLANFRAIAANPSDYGTARAMSAVEAGPSKHQTRRPHEAAPVRNKLSFPARRKNWVTLGITVLFLVSAITIGYRYSIERKVQNRLKALQRAGLPITVEEWNRRRAPLTNEVNAAEVIERAIPALVAVRWLPRSIQRNLPGWREESSRPDPIPHEMQQAIASVLSSNQSALAVLHAAPSLKAARYAWAGTPSVTQIQGFWTITQLLEWEVFLRAEEGDVPGAMDSLGRLLDLGRALAREPGMSVQWIKATSIKRAFSAMQWLLTRRALTETELETLQQSLAQVADRTNLEPALTELRCLAVESYRTLSVGEQTVSGPGGPPPMELTRLYLQNRIRHWTGATDRELLAFLDELDEFARIVRAALPLRFKRAEELVPKSASAISVWNSRYVFKYLITPDAVFEAQRRTALTSLAVERFRVHHAGRLPDSLADVGSPENTEMLHDPFDGRLLRYKMLPKGYCVYSVGVNGKDDGGADPQGVPWAKTANDDISFSVQR